MDYRKALIDYCNGLGLDTIGFTNCRKFKELVPLYQARKEKGLENEFEEEDIEKRINPKHYMENGKVIISIAFPYLKDLTFEESPAFSKYTLGRDYHMVVKSYLEKISSYINSLGGEALIFSDNNTLPERYIAYLSGIGFIGKNNMLITPKYGSYVFLGEIITDLDIEIINDDSRSFEQMEKYKECRLCDKCFKACPTKAINKSSKNCNICLSYITQKKQIDDKWFEILKGRIFGCDTCQKSCPFNDDVSLSNIEDFKPFDFMKNILLEDIIYIDNKTFKERYYLTSCGWRGKAVLQRNALIRYVKVEGKKNIDIKKINSPYVKEYCERLLKFE